MSCGSTSCSSTQTFVLRSGPFNETDRLWLHPLVRWIGALGEMYSRRRQRQALSQLDDDQLTDIGLSRQQAEREARKPFWQ